MGTVLQFLMHGRMRDGRCGVRLQGERRLVTKVELGKGLDGQLTAEAWGVGEAIKFTILSVTVTV